MINFFKALILLPVAVLVVLLAVANRGPVTLSLDPFSREAPEIAFTVPLFAVVFGAVMLGVIIGGIMSWMAQGKHRRAERLYRREARRLRAQSAHGDQRRPDGARPARPRPASGSMALVPVQGSGSRL